MASDDTDPMVQMNVRVRRSLVTAVDQRRKPLKLSRDEWVRRLIPWGLQQPHPDQPTQE